MHKSFAVLLCLVLGACATQIGLQNAADRRQVMFSQVVFAADYDSRRTDYLAKWMSPIRIVIQGDAADKYKTGLKGQIASLAKTAGFSMGLTTESKPSNVTIHFATSSELQALVAATAVDVGAARAGVAATGCHPEIEKDDDHTITAGRLYVQVNPGAEKYKLLSGTYNEAEASNEEARVKLCLLRGLLSILGFANPSDVITPSIFNFNSALSQPTTLDLKMIRTLYDPALKPGMPRREALAVASTHLEK